MSRGERIRKNFKVKKSVKSDEIESFTVTMDEEIQKLILLIFQITGNKSIVDIFNLIMLTGIIQILKKYKHNWNIYKKMVKNNPHKVKQEFKSILEYTEFLDSCLDDEINLVDELRELMLHKTEDSEEIKNRNLYYEIKKLD